MEPKTLYHGSEKRFEKFGIQSEHIHGTDYGYGLYFATTKEHAAQYGNIIYKVELLGKRVLNSKNLSITKAELRNVIVSLEKSGIEILSNYGDVDYEGYETVMENALQIILDSNANDMVLIGDIIGTSGGYEREILELFASLNYTHGFAYAPNGDPIAVVIDPQCLTILEIMES